MPGRGLVTHARGAEDVASGLRVYLDQLPDRATEIAAIISELFAISSNLRALENAYGDPRYQPAFHRIRGDIQPVLLALDYSLGAAREIFGRSREAPLCMVWDHFCHSMEEREGAGFCERLEWCRVFTKDLFDVLRGSSPDRLSALRRRLVVLLDAQDVSQAYHLPFIFNASSLSTPRPGAPRLPSYRIETPLSPASISDDWNYTHVRPPSPEPPQGQPPLSPTFTSSSSHTLSSSATSYSGPGPGPYPPMPYTVTHWADRVFDGRNPTTLIDDTRQFEPSKCYDTPNPAALHQLAQDGFVQALDLAFDSEPVRLRLYWRPSDHRSRALFITTNSRREQVLFCKPLTALKIVRRGATLELCRMPRPDVNLQLWARLKFVFYERMVLFYNTFIAMKRQDHRPLIHEGLADMFELREEEEFGGQIRDSEYRHALRIFRDVRSGVMRVEASALRGPMQDVPIWTAFLNRYLGDRDWMQYEGSAVVSLIALRPPPYVFLHGYEPRRAPNGDYELCFVTREDADEFRQTWHTLCRGV